MSIAQDFLNRMRIASPCSASWADMTGDDRARFCASCEKHVYDFSKMTAEQGVALIREKEGKVCGRLWRRADGTVITADCPVGVKRVKRRLWLPVSKAAALVVASLAANLACAPKQPVKVAQSAPTAKSAEPVRSMTTTVDYSQTIPVATVRICESENAPDTVEVGNMVNFASDAWPLDFDSPTTGMKMTHDQWEHLPLQ
ncbi:MAG: hypothetical protein JST24_06815 [Acidobacteria bacterium]|nr:hypothetical protein [Acidobacteriota bacterium]